MKRSVTLALFLISIAAFLLTSCGEASVYGTWYNDSGNTRNAIQFSENKNGDNVYVWVVYDIENDTIKSNLTGYYSIDKSIISLRQSDGGEGIELTYKLEGDSLSLISDSTEMVLTRFTLEN